MGIFLFNFRTDKQRIIIWRLVFFSALSAVMILALMPTSGVQGFTGQDKLLHCITFSVLFLMACQGYPNQAYRKWLYLGLFFYGVSMELLQGQTDYRSMEMLDLVADILGITLGYLLLTFYARYFPKHRSS